MNDLDKTTFERFARRFASIERLVPNPPAPPSGTARAIRPVGRPMWALVGVAILMVAAVGLAIIGSQPAPSPTPAAIAMPPDSAGPDVVLDAFLRAAAAGDCATSRALKATLLAEKGFFDLCGLTDVQSFSVTDGPITVDPDKVRFSGTVTITGIGVDLPAGAYRWTYFVQRQTNGTWRLVDGGYFSPVAPPLTPGPTRPTPGELQVANSDLGGTGWTITELDGEAQSELAHLSFSGGPTGGPASGSASTDCSFVAFDYAYYPGGPSIAFFLRNEGDGSYMDGCSAADLLQAGALKSALSRVAQWRKSQPDQIELLSLGGAVILKGGPLPPLPTAPPVGDCADVPLADCERAAALGFNFDLFPADGQTVVSWRVRPSIYTACSSPGDPKYDVIFQLGNPASERITTVVELYGKLIPCGAY